MRALASECRLGSAVNSSVMACLAFVCNRLTSRKVSENRAVATTRLNAARVAAGRE